MFNLKKPCLDSIAATNRPETAKLPPIPEVVWQQPQEANSIDMYKNATTDIQCKNDVESQTSPMKETSSQVSGSNTDALLENETRSTPVQCLNDSKKQRYEIQGNETGETTYDSGGDKISPAKKTT